MAFDPSVFAQGLMQAFNQLGAGFDRMDERKNMWLDLEKKLELQKKHKFTEEEEALMKARLGLLNAQIGKVGASTRRNPKPSNSWDDFGV